MSSASATVECVPTDSKPLLSHISEDFRFLGLPLLSFLKLQCLRVINGNGSREAAVSPSLKLQETHFIISEQTILPVRKSPMLSHTYVRWGLHEESDFAISYEQQ